MAVTATNQDLDKIQNIGTELCEVIYLTTGGADTTATVGAAGSGATLKLRRIQRITRVRGYPHTAATGGATVAITDLIVSKVNPVEILGLG